MGAPSHFNFHPYEGIGLNLPGHRQTPCSTWSDVGNTMWSQVEEQKITLFGYSMGGRIALSMFEKNPERVNSLILCSAQFEAPQNSKARIHIDAKRAADLRKDPEAFLNWWGTLELFGPQLAPLWQVIYSDRLQRALQESLSWADALQSLSVSMQPNFSEILKKHAHKITFIYGENDEKYSKFAEDYKKINIVTIAIPDAWHAPHLDNPNVFMKVIQDLKV